MDSIGLLLLVQLILIALNAVFACAEIAVLSVSDAKLSKLVEQGNKKAKRLQKLTAEPAKFLSTIQVAITLSGFLGSALAAENFSDPIVDWLVGLGVGIPVGTLNTIVVVLITLVLSYFTLVFGELVPKRIAMKRSEQLALGISGLISAISRLFAPIVWVLSISTNGILRLFGIDPNEEDEQVSEEEIRLMVDAGSENGAIDDEEKEIIQNVFEFDDTTAGDIATHRTEVAILWQEDSDEEWAQTIHNNRHTRYPICEGSADHIIGVLNAKDYYRLEDKSRKNVMENAVRTPYFVPETITADVLFRNMKESRTSLAVVLDEYGGMVGIVTLFDLIEELLGDINEETTTEEEAEEPHLTGKDENVWEVNGNVDLREIEEVTGLSFEDTEYGTLTGLVFDSLELVPQDGEQDIDLEVGRLQIHVSRITDHQVEQATIRLLEAPQEEEEE